MVCPKCKRGEIKAAGKCPNCGYSIVKVAQPLTLPFPAIENVVSFPAEKTKKSTDSGAHLRIVKEKPIPSWRLEVSQKVQEVLRSREGKSSSAATAVSAPPATQSAAKSPEPATAVAVAPAGAPSVSGNANSGTTPTTLTAAAAHQPKKAEAVMTPLFKGTALELTRVSTHSMTRREDPPPPPLATDGGASVAPTRSPQVLLGSEAVELEMDYPPDPEPVRIESQTALPDRSLLLSRSLAGLIDFIVVLFSSIPFFFTLVYLSGYDDIDEYSLLILLGISSGIYYLYSVFFLSFCGQSIGMMITDLQVVNTGGGLPTCSRSFHRVLAFTVAVGMCGLGLSWGLFDRRSRCLHDLLSHTLVIRVAHDDMP